MITSTDYEQTLCVLVDADGQPVRTGQEVTDFRGAKANVVCGAAPLHSGSTGLVSLSSGRSCYPGVFNLRWVSHHEVTA